MSDHTARRAATYARKSNEDRQRPGKSTGDQRHEARAEVERREWTLVADLHDDAVGASRHSRRKARPGFDELLRLIGDRKIDAVVMAEQSRVTRSLSVLGPLIDECADAGIVLVVGGEEIDPAKPDGLLRLGITGSVDAAESARTRDRTLRGMRGAAAQGRPHGRPVYGYTRVYDERTRALLRVDPSADAPTVVTIIDRLLGGEPLRAVTRDLNQRGVPSPTGKTWAASTVSRVARNPAYAGLRVHQGKVVGTGQWPALISEDRHRAVVSRLTDPARVTTRPGAQRHLLTAAAFCGECGGPLRRLANRGRNTYNCVSCFRITIGYDDLNEFVTDAVITYLSGNDLAETIEASSGDGYASARAALDAIDARRAEARKLVVMGVSTADEVAADLRALAVERRRAEARLRLAAPDPLVLDVAGPDAARRFANLPLDARRTLVTSLVRVVVGRSTRPRGSRGFDRTRVALQWRDISVSPVDASNQPTM